MKILIADSCFAPFVAPIRTSFLIKVRGWIERGAQVTIICSTEAVKFYEKELPGVNFLAFSFKWKAKTLWGVPWEYTRTNLLISPFIFKMRGKFDIVYSLTSTLNMIFFPWALKLLDHKVRWFTMMDNLVPKPSERPGSYVLKVIPYLAFLAANFLLKKTDGMFVVTNLLKQYYEKKGIKVIKTGTGNGLDIESFVKEINPKTPHFTALFGGRLHPVKGIFDLTVIAKEVVKKDKKYTLGVMGTGDEKTTNKLLEIIKINNLTKNIFLLGHKDTRERWDLYRNSDYFLFPSYAEGCPQVVLEAFAANKLVVAYDLPEYRDAFDKYLKNEQLIVFKKGDTKSMVNYILSFKNTPKFHNKLADYGWDKIVENEWKAFAKYE